MLKKGRKAPFFVKILPDSKKVVFAIRFRLTFIYHFKSISQTKNNL